MTEQKAGRRGCTRRLGHGCNTLQSIDVPNVSLGSLVADRLASHPRPGPSLFGVVISLAFDVVTPGLANLPINHWACEDPLLHRVFKLK